MNVGDTFILFNQQMKGNKRELIQLGVPLFGPVKEDAKSKNDEMIETNFNNLTYYLEQEIDLVFLIVSANLRLFCNSFSLSLSVYRQYRANSSTSPRCH